MLRLALVVIGVLPFVTWASSFASIDALSNLVDPVFAFHCHRAPHRILELFGRRLPVCARCTGIYAGIVVGALVRAPPVSKRVLSWAALSTAALLLADVVTESLGWRVPSLSVRFLTGFAFAFTSVLAALSGAFPETVRR